MRGERRLYLADHYVSEKRGFRYILTSQEVSVTLLIKLTEEYDD